MTRSPKAKTAARFGFVADFGPEHADTFRRDLHPKLRAEYVLATAERDSAFSTAKPYCRACRRQYNPMPFNDSDWFRKDDGQDKRCDPSRNFYLWSEAVCQTQ